MNIVLSEIVNGAFVVDVKMWKSMMLCHRYALLIY